MRSLSISAVLLCLLARAASPCTPVSGSVNGGHWTVAGSPYCVMGNIQINSLTIDPGVRVEVHGDYEIKVAGILLAIGTAADSIEFCPADTVAGWQGIFYNAAPAGNRLAYCIVRGSTNSGIRIYDSAPDIDHSLITRNTAVNGAGMFIDIDNATRLIVSNSLIRSNVSTGHGAGVYVTRNTGRVVFRGCVVDSNRTGSRDVNGDRYGGGLYLRGAVDVFRCGVRYNESVGRNQGFSAQAQSYGAGIFIADANSLVRVGNTIVWNNLTYVRAFGGPGFPEAYGYGAGIFAVGQLKLANSIVAYNTLDVSGAYESYPLCGGVFVNGGTTEIVNSNVAKNSHQGVYRNNGTVSLANSIVYYNAGSETQGAMTARYCDINGGYSGEGNIDAGPIFADENSDLTIVFPSPCIDRGNPCAAYNEVCFPPSLGGTRNDIGAHGGPGACGWISECDDQCFMGDATCPLFAASMSPAPGETGVAPLDSVRVTFNRKINPTTMSAANWSFNYASGGAAIAGTYRVATDSLTAYFRPTSYLRFGQTVNTCLEAAVAAPDGRTLGRDTCWSFTVNDSSILAIMGSVALFDDPNVKIRNVRMDIDPGADTLTDASGSYAFLELAAGNYKVKPSKTGDLGTALDAADASLVARHAIGAVAWDPFLKRAADVTGNGQVSALDASWIARRVLVSSTPWPTGRDWLFEPDSVMYQPLVPGRVSENYVAIACGDMNGSWRPQAPSLALESNGVPGRVELSADGTFDLVNDIGDEAWGFDCTLRSDLSEDEVRSAITLIRGDWVLAVAAIQAGEVRMVGYGTTAVSAGAGIARFDFGKRRAGWRVTITALRINATPRPEIDVTILDPSPIAFALHPAAINPVPASQGVVRMGFALHQSGPALLELYDIRGARIARRDLGWLAAGEYEGELPIAGLRGGVYFCRLESGARRAVQKLVVSR